MKTILLFACVLLLSTISYGQNKLDITGAWKITSFNAGVYHNYKTDSTAVSEKMKESLKGSADSAITIALITVLVKEFDNYLYIFQPNGQYQEKKGEKVKQHGTYTLDEGRQLITLIVKDKFGGESRQNLHYRKTRQALEFKIPLDEMEIILNLEKFQ